MFTEKQKTVLKAFGGGYVKRRKWRDMYLLGCSEYACNSKRRTFGESSYSGRQEHPAVLVSLIPLALVLMGPPVSVPESTAMQI